MPETATRMEAQYLTRGEEFFYLSEKISDNKRDLAALISETRKDLSENTKEFREGYIRLDKKIDDRSNRLDEKIDDRYNRLDDKIEIVRTELKGEIKAQLKWIAMIMTLYSGLIIAAFKFLKCLYRSDKLSHFCSLKLSHSSRSSCKVFLLSK
ncbi:MAG: hypothetical protein QME81_11040 [bacterium]|nr:hypothetical protein [bacterium]